MPAALVFVAITSIATILVDPDPGLSLKTGITSLVGLSKIVLYNSSTGYFTDEAKLNSFLNTWSLDIEEQFYIIFPFILWYSGFIGKGNRAPDYRKI